jgi:hypothetical protein
MSETAAVLGATVVCDPDPHPGYEYAVQCGDCGLREKGYGTFGAASVAATGHECPNGMRVEDFDRRYRFLMVQAYPVISGVRNVYEATHDEIDAGFARCLQNRNLRDTHRMYLKDRRMKVTCAPAAEPPIKVEGTETP